MKANRLILSRSNELIYDGGNTWFPIMAVKTASLLEALTAHGETAIQVKFRTTTEGAEQDVKTYTRRLRSLAPFFTFGAFKPQVIDGHEMPTVFTTILNRSC